MGRSTPAPKRRPALATALLRVMQVFPFVVVIALVLLFWFYRDRFQEQYGKKCEFNPVLQNCTFALMDTEQGRLYVLETDF